MNWNAQGLAVAQKPVAPEQVPFSRELVVRFSDAWQVSGNKATFMVNLDRALTGMEVMTLKSAFIANQAWGSSANFNALSVFVNEVGSTSTTSQQAPPIGRPTFFLQNAFGGAVNSKYFFEERTSRQHAADVRGLKTSQLTITISDESMTPLLWDDSTTPVVVLLFGLYS